jgi:hypothetical protein
VLRADVLRATCYVLRAVEDDYGQQTRICNASGQIVQGPGTIGYNCHRETPSMRKVERLHQRIELIALVLGAVIFALAYLVSRLRG